MSSILWNVSLNDMAYADLGIGKVREVYPILAISEQNICKLTYWPEVWYTGPILKKGKGAEFDG